MQKLVLVFFIITFLLKTKNGVTQNFPKSYTTTIGTSAISVKTLTAKSYSFTHLIYSFKIDTLSNQLFVTTRKKEPSGLYSNIGVLAAINCTNDSIKWLTNVTQFDIKLAHNYLFTSSKQKTSLYNKTYGYEQFQFPAKVIYYITKNKSGLMYNPINKDELMCINLQDGSLKWKTTLSSQQNWNDVKYLNDTTLLIAANGLAAVNINTGLLWSIPLNTAQKNNTALKYSSFNNEKIKSEFYAVNTSTVEGQICNLSSNILVSDSVIYYAAKEKLIALHKNGTLLWEYGLDETATSQMLLSKVNSDIVLLNTGIAQFNDFVISYGKAFAMSINCNTGKQNFKNNSVLESLADYSTFQNDLIFANKTNIAQTNIANASLQPIIEITEQKFGKFLEFIDSHIYYIEKEGFYVPLNFINDNVIYFRTDNDKVYGVSKNTVEYEYHYTELYKLNNNLGDKKLITQNKKTLLISKNYELLFNFNLDVPCYVFGTKIYFIKDRFLHIVDYNNLQ